LRHNHLEMQILPSLELHTAPKRANLSPGDADSERGIYATPLGAFFVCNQSGLVVTELKRALRPQRSAPFFVWVALQFS
jgi:hypothetical protein